MKGLSSKESACTALYASRSSGPSLSAIPAFHRPAMRRSAACWPELPTNGQPLHSSIDPGLCSARYSTLIIACNRTRKEAASTPHSLISWQTRATACTAISSDGPIYCAPCGQRRLVFSGAGQQGNESGCSSGDAQGPSPATRRPESKHSNQRENRSTISQSCPLALPSGHPGPGCQSMPILPRR